MTAALVIAVRGGLLAKSRCASVLSALDRQALVTAMLDDMLSAATAVADIVDITVVTPTPALADLAVSRGAFAIREAQPLGVNAAFARGGAAARARVSGGSLLILPGDLPLIRPRDLEGLIVATRSGAVALAPSRLDGGTGAIGLPAGVDLPFLFGPDSYRRHWMAVRSLGHTLQVIDPGPLGLDIDHPRDLAQIAYARHSRSAAVLRSILAAYPYKEIA